MYYATDADLARPGRDDPLLPQGPAAPAALVLQPAGGVLRSKEPVRPARLTIEHVLPQTPTTDVERDAEPTTWVR